MTFANKRLSKIKQVGSDIDPEIFSAIGPVFSYAKKWIYLQHVIERDSYKLDKLKAILPQKKQCINGELRIRKE